MATASKVIRNFYRDSVSLMQLSSRLGKLPGMKQASVIMASEANLALLREAGLISGPVDAGPNDILVALQADSDVALRAAMDEAVAAYQRIELFVVRATEMLGGFSGDSAPGAADDDQGVLPTSFCSAMDEDLGVPKALAAVHACVRDGNQALTAGDKTGLRTSLARLRAMLGVLGLDPLAPHWSGSDAGSGSGGYGSSERLRGVVSALFFGGV